MKALFSVFLLSFAVACAWVYLRKPSIGPGDKRGTGDDDRPWRRVGAAICLLVSIMFVAGVYLVDIPDRPRIYAAFWVVIMGLVIWLCVLAVKDARYTRQMISRRRDRRKLSDGSLPGDRGVTEDSK